MRLLLSLLSLAVSPWALATPLYRLVDLGSSAATALNASGAAAGWTWDAASQTMRAFTPSTVGAPGRAQGINDAGEAVGIEYDGAGNAVAVRWDSNGMRTALAGVDSYAMAVNNSGVAVGSVEGEAVWFLPGGTQQRAGLAGTGYALNDAGTMAGTAQLANGGFRAFTASPGGGGGGATVLGTLGGRASYGHAINASGSVAGAAATRQGFLHAFLHQYGTMHDLGTLGGANSGAYGVNGFGLVVGYSLNEAGDSLAFLWKNGAMLDLNQLVAHDAAWRLAEASAINDRGQIVGFGYRHGEMRAFRLDPVIAPAAPDAATAVPEPEAGVLLLIAVVVYLSWPRVETTLSMRP